MSPLQLLLLLSFVTLAAGTDTTVIAVSVSVGIIVLVLVTIVVIVWLYLCLHKGRTGGRGGRRKPPEDDDEEEYSPLTPAKRAKSLNLFNSREAGKFPFDKSSSTENLLLSRSQTKSTGIDQEEDLDLLNLDETLFAATGSNLRTKSEGHLNSPEKSPRKPSVLARKASDPATIYQQPTQPTVIIEEAPTSFHREHKSLGDMPIHHSSRRASTNSDHSDLSSDFERSQNSSTLFKSVRFEIEDDSGVDSGAVTGTSTPYYPERRASEPEFKASYPKERRASAPECKSPEEDSGNELQCSDTRIMPEAKQDNKEEAATAQEVTTSESIRPPVIKQLVRTQNEETDNSPPREEHDSTTQQPSPIQITPSSENTPPTTPKRHCEVTKVPSSPLRVAHLVASVERGKAADTSIHRDTLPKSHVKSQKIVEIQQRFQQETLVTKENTQQPELPRRRSSMSKLITERQQQLLQEPISKEKPIVKPQKMNVQWPKPDDSHEYESSSSSSVLASSIPKIDLTKWKETRSQDKFLQSEPDTKRDGSTTSLTVGREDEPLKPELKSKGDGSTTSLTASSQVSGLDESNDDMAEQDDESDSVPWFERDLSGIPLFTFGSKFSQPTIMKGEQLSDFWSFAGTPDIPNEPMGQDLGDLDSDDEMVSPLTPTSSISPIGRAFGSLRFPTAKLHMSAIKDMKQSQMAVSEPYQRPFGYHQKLASRLSAIPEESPELTRSRTSLNAVHRTSISAQ